jgi:hypothetical protein
VQELVVKGLGVGGIDRFVLLLQRSKDVIEIDGLVLAKEVQKVLDRFGNGLAMVLIDENMVLIAKNNNNNKQTK